MTNASEGPSTAVAELAGALAVLVGGTVLVGWASDHAALKSILPGFVSVKPNTALSFILTGIALLRPPSTLSPRSAAFVSRLAQLCALLAGVIGLLTLSEYVFGWNPGFDQWLFPEPAGTVGTSQPGRMAPDTALCFVFVAVGVGIFRPLRKTTGTFVASAILGALVTTVALASILAHFSPALRTQGWWGLTVMAAPTATLFVALGVALALLAWQESRPESGSPVKPVDGSGPRAGLAFLLVFLVLAAGIVSTGIFYYRNYERHYRAEVEHQLSAIAELKVSQLVRWRKERVGDGSIFFRNSAISALMRRLLERPEDADAQRQLQLWIAKYQRRDDDYDQVRLLDARGVTLLSSPAGLPAVSTSVARDVSDVLRSGQMMFQDLYRNDYDRRIYLGILVPILDERDASRPLGVLALRVDPESYLYPSINRWPTPSLTAETLLVRRDGNDALFLNELRFQTNTALNLRVPLDRTRMPAVQAALGREGVMEGIDYRGVPAVAALRTIPDSPWALVARMGTAEVYGPMRGQLWQVVVLTGALLLGAGACVGLVWRQQSVRFYREEAAAAETIRETKDYLENLINHANAPIIVWDTQFKITRFNHAFETLTGRPAGEVIGKSLEILFPPSLMESMMALIKKPLEGERWETVEIPVLHLDGSVRTVLWNSATVLAVDGKTPVAAIAQGQDITARMRYRALFHNMLNGFAYCRMQYDDHASPVDFVYLDVNEAFERLTGLTNVVGKPVSEVIPGLRESSPELFEAYGRVASTGISETFEFDLKSQGQWLIISVYSTEKGYFAAVFDDITERKRVAEESQMVLRTAMDGFWIVDMQGRFLEANEAYCRLIGYTRDELLAMKVTEIEAAESSEETAAHFATLARTGSDRFLTRHRRKDGAILDVEVSATYLAPTGGRLFVFVRDITEQKQAQAELSKLRVAVDASNEVVFMTDVEGVITSVNPAFTRLYGYSAAEVVGHTTPRILKSGRMSREGYESFWNAILSKQVVTGELVNKTKDGRFLTIESSANPVFNEQRERIGFLAIQHDITERKLTERALRRSETRYRAVAQSANLAIVTADSAGNIVDWNPHAETMFGYTPAEILGQSLTLLIPEQHRERHLAGMRRVQSGGESHIIGRRVELEGRRKDTSEFPLGLSLAKWTTAEGWFVTGMMTDITERKEVDMQRERVAALVEATPDFIGFADPKTAQLLYINKYGRRMCGLGEDEDIGTLKISDMHPAWMNTRLAEVILPAAVRDGVWEGEGAFLHRDGREIPVLMAFLVRRAANGEADIFYTVSHDITERKRLETQFLHAQKMESVGRLASGIAHDFNNLLTVINGMSDLVLEKLRNEDPMHADVQEIGRAGERAATLTRQLLAFSRQQILVPRVLNLNTVVTGMERLLQRVLGEDIDLVIVLTPDGGYVTADPGQIEQVLSNLAVNARDAMPRGGQLTIETQNVTIDEGYAHPHGMAMPLGSYVMLTVSDSGVGMDEAIRARIFEPFFTTKEPGKGTGLGLSTVYGIVKQSHGFIWFDSEVGQGTSFKICLPQVIEAADTAGPKPTAVPGSGTETILLVEDNAGLRKLATRFLEPAGYTVLGAATGEEALRVLERHQGAVHLLLSDVVMPGMSGRDLAECLAQTRPKMKVLYMSGYTSDTIVRHGVLDGQVAFLNKPFTKPVLLRKVREVLDL